MDATGRTVRTRGRLKSAGAAMAGLMVLAATGDKVEAQMSEIQGRISFADGKAIPPGILKIRLEDPAGGRPQRALGQTRIKAAGGDKTVAFSLPAARGERNLMIVVRLEREDGWLLARGSAPIKAGAPAEVKLRTVQY